MVDQIEKKQKLDQPVKKLKGSKIFQPYRALGVVTNQTPFCVQKRGDELFVTLSVGKVFQIYDAAKFHLKFVGKPLKDDISYMCAYKNYTLVASGGVVYQYFRAKRTGLNFGDKENYSKIIQMVCVEDRLVVLYEDNALRVWNAADGELYTEIQFDPTRFTANFLCHPLGYHNKILVGSSEGRMQLWNFGTRKMLFEFPGFGSGVSFIKSAPVVDVVCVGYLDGTVEIMNIRMNQKLMTLSQEGAVTGISFRTDDTPLLATSSSNGDIALWNLDEGKIVHLMKNSHAGSVCSLEFIEGKPVLMTSGSDNSIKQWIFDKMDGTPRIHRQRSGHQSAPNYVRFHDDEGKYLLSVGTDRSLRLTSVIRDQQNIEFSQGNLEKKANNLNIFASDLKMPPALMLSSATQREREWDAVITCHANCTHATTWNYERKALGKYSFKSLDKSNIKQVALSHCGNFAIIGCASGRIEMFNMQSGEHRRSFVKDGHNGVITGIAIDNLNKILVTSGLDGNLKAWDFVSGKCQETLSFDFPISKIVLNLNNNLLAVALDDMSIKIVDIERMQVVRDFNGHSARITDMAFNSDGRWLVSASTDRSIRTWDVPSGHLVDMFLVPTICTSVDFSPTSEFLATTHVNSVAIYLWTNTTLLAPVTLKPLDADKSEMIDSEMPLIGGGSEEQNENDEDTESDEVLYFGKLKLADGLVTLTSEPHSKWHNLLHLDTIKKRNKPKEPPKAPEEAPFFLSTVPGLEPKFQVPEKAQADETNNSRIMNFEQFGSIETDFQIKLRRAVELNNQREFFGFLKSLGISTVDLEIQSIGLSQNTNDLANLLRILDWSLSEKLDYEFVQSLLARVLKVHSDLIYSNMDVFEPILESLESKHESTWSKIDDLFNNTMCAINFLR